MKEHKLYSTNLNHFLLYDSLVDARRAHRSGLPQDSDRLTNIAGKIRYWSQRLRMKVDILPRNEPILILKWHPRSHFYQVLTSDAKIGWICLWCDDDIERIKW